MIAMCGQIPLIMQRRLMGLATDSAADSHAELDRMVREKMEAAGESFVEAGFQVMRESAKMSLAFLSGDVNALAGSADRIASSAVGPYAKRVRKNSVRLGKPGAKGGPKKTR